MGKVKTALMSNTMDDMGPVITMEEFQANYDPQTDTAEYSKTAVTEFLARTSDSDYYDTDDDDADEDTIDWGEWDNDHGDDFKTEADND